MFRQPSHLQQLRHAILHVIRAIKGRTGIICFLMRGCVEISVHFEFGFCPLIASNSSRLVFVTA